MRWCWPASPHCWADEGLAAPTFDDVCGDLYLHPFPPSFDQAPSVKVVRPMRPVGSLGHHRRHAELAQRARSGSSSCLPHVRHRTRRRAGAVGSRVRGAGRFRRRRAGDDRPAYRSGHTRHDPAQRSRRAIRPAAVRARSRRRDHVPRRCRVIAGRGCGRGPATAQPHLGRPVGERRRRLRLGRGDHLRVGSTLGVRHRNALNGCCMRRSSKTPPFASPVRSRRCLRRLITSRPSRRWSPVRRERRARWLTRRCVSGGAWVALWTQNSATVVE